MMWTGPFGSPMWGVWWIFPLIGMLLCFTFLVLAVRFVATGRGFMCMGGHQATGHDDVAAMREEIRTLREEIEQLRASR